jgi:hypothetical protein
MEVPAVTEVVAIRAVPEVIVVVESIDPGAIKAAGMLKVTVLPAFATPIWFAVGAIIIFPAVGVSELIVTTPPVVPDPKAIHNPAAPEYM